MYVQYLQNFRCPRCTESGLVLSHRHEGNEVEILNGQLACLGCNQKFPIINGVPRFVASDEYADSFGLQWKKHRQAQLDSYSGISLSHDRFFEVTRWPRDLAGEKVLEVGCGAGRFTEIVQKTGADLFSMDLSSAVDANFKNHGMCPNVTVLQGSVYDLPFAKESFDRVFCLGVLQHTPDPEKSFALLATMVKPGGYLAVDVYAKRITTVICWKYILRPLTKRVKPTTLYRFLARVVPWLVEPTKLLRKIFGRVGTRLSPILEYSHLGLSDELNQEWAILDTFDMYSPQHDHPQSEATLRRWFIESDFSEFEVMAGPNGVIGRGKKSSGTS